MIKLVELERIQPDMFAAEDIFVSGQTTPIVRKNTLLTTRIVRQLKVHGIKKVPVEMDKPPAMGLPEIQEIKPVMDEKLKEDAMDGIRRMFLAAGEGDSEETMTTAYQAVKQLDNVVDRLVDTISSEAGALVHIADLKSYDEYTYHHSLSVAVLSIAIGQSIGLSDDKIRLTGRCAMMHDIGKMHVPNEIINKPSRLSDEEFAMVKRHSQNGYQYLSKGEIGDETLWQGVLCHHEKLDGSGYPNGLKGDEIPLISRIISVADVYDAVTSHRAYRAPMPPAEALELIMSDIGRAFDYDIVKAFVDKLELYPVNSVIELSNQKRAVVIENANAMRPVVKLLETGEVVDLMGRNYLNLVIVRVLENHGF